MDALSGGHYLTLVPQKKHTLCPPVICLIVKGHRAGPPILTSAFMGTAMDTNQNRKLTFRVILKITRPQVGKITSEIKERTQTEYIYIMGLALAVCTLRGNLYVQVIGLYSINKYYWQGIITCAGKEFIIIIIILKMFILEITEISPMESGPCGSKTTLFTSLLRKYSS